MTVVVRFSSLGDVVLAAGVTAAIGDVAFVTPSIYAPLVERFAGVERVVAWERGTPLRELAARVPDGDVVDLHGSLRSRALVLRLGRSASRPRRHRRAIFERVAWKRFAGLPPVVERYAEAAGVAVAPLPWLPLERAPTDLLALAPGARWATKRWPTERWVELADAWEGGVALLGGPDELDLLSDVARRSARAVSVCAEAGFDRTLELLGSARAVVAGDTGLLHLAGASGVPVVGIFGPTRSQDGFWCYPGEVAELDLPCRPCSRFGGARCPIGDHACLEELSTELVRQRIEALA